MKKKTKTTPKAAAKRTAAKRGPKPSSAEMAAKKATSKKKRAGERTISAKQVTAAGVKPARPTRTASSKLKPTTGKGRNKPVGTKPGTDVSTGKSDVGTASKSVPIKIPPILLEGDEPQSHSVGGPGFRYTLGPTAPDREYAEAELPEAYGTERLILTARDPHWLYAHWDFTNDQLKRYNALSPEGHLTIRVYLEEDPKTPVTEAKVHPESRHWFVYVADANKCYVAEIGYHDAEHAWQGLSRSDGTWTPPDAESADRRFQLATIPADVPFARLVEIVRSAMQENVELASAIREIIASGGHPGFTVGEDLHPHLEWTSEQQAALADVINLDSVRRVWVGSLEITELVRRQLEKGISSMVQAAEGWPTSPAQAPSVPGAISSPLGGAAEERGFWFNLNAEVIVYGATEPGATVKIGDRTLKLRPDGSFSLRFALPDGSYSLPVSATSEDGLDRRSAKLDLGRATQYQGDVGTHPRDPTLKQPGEDNV